MRKRLWIFAVTALWLAMMVWLWRTEFGARRQPGGVPTAVVWKKMLTAPDPSRLDIYYKTNLIGSCHWRADVGQEIATGARMLEDEPVEGMVQQLSHYSLDLEGAMKLPDFPRLTFNLKLRLDTNQTWQSFEGHASMRPDLYQLSINSAAQTVRLYFDAGGEKTDRTFRFSDFQNPQKVLTDAGGPMLPVFAGALGVPLTTNKASGPFLGLRWEARNDSLLIGGNRVRAYRLQSKLFERYRITFFISPVGEVLRAEIPGDILLVNEALAGLRQSSSDEP
jgi:hypothetical protein